MTTTAAAAPVIAYRPALAESDRTPAVGGRLVSLDAYRGFVMLLMASEGLAIANYAEQTGGGSVWRFLAYQTDHVEWRGCTMWDLIQPSFTFIVGVALPFSLARRRADGSPFWRLLLHAIYRSFLLVALGVFLRSRFKSQTYFTFEDTLSQIGLGYPFAFLLAWLRPRWQITAAAVILVGYWLAFALYPLPPLGFDWTSVGVTGKWRAAYGLLNGFARHWDKNTNAAAAFDVWFLNLWPREKHFAINVWSLHRWPYQKPFVFNNGGYLTLSFIPTLATIILGLLAGHLMRGRATAGRKFGTLIVAGAAGIALGKFLDLTGICPSVKRIWTPSWVLFSGGWACWLLAAFYAVIDWAGLRAWAFPLRVAGLNSIALYCLDHDPFRRFVVDSLHIHLGRQFFPHLAGPYAPIVESVVVLFVLWLVCLWMYRRKIFLRI